MTWFGYEHRGEVILSWSCKEHTVRLQLETGNIPPTFRRTYRVVLYVVNIFDSNEISKLVVAKTCTWLDMHNENNPCNAVVLPTSFGPISRNQCLHFLPAAASQKSFSSALDFYRNILVTHTSFRYKALCLHLLARHFNGCPARALAALGKIT